MINNIKQPLSQWDNRWKDTIIETATIGVVGCTITALSMLTSNSKVFNDPNQVELIVDFTNSSHPSGANLIVWDSITKLEGVIAYKRFWTNSLQAQTEVQNAINNGDGVLIQIMDGNLGQHWLACAKFGNAWECVDPRNGKARNIAFREATGYCIVFLNKDKPVVVDPAEEVKIIAHVKKQMELPSRDFVLREDTPGVSYALKDIGSTAYKERWAWITVGEHNGFRASDFDTWNAGLKAGQTIRIPQWMYPDNNNKLEVNNEKIFERPAKIETKTQDSIQVVEDVNQTADSQLNRQIDYPKPNQSEKYSVNKAAIDVSRSNVDKSVIVGAITSLIIVANSYFELDLPVDQISILGGAMATILIAGGVFRQNKND